MPPIPSREAFAALIAAAGAIAPVAVVGFVRRQDRDTLSIHYADANGIGGHVLADDEVAEVFRLPAEFREGPIDRLFVNRSGAVESHLTLVGVHYVVTLPIPGADVETVFWVGLRRAESPTADEISGLRAVAEQAGALLTAPEPTGVAMERLARLELTAQLLPALLQVLDVRQIFGVLSTISGQAVAHDLLALGLMSDDLTQVTVYAQTGATGQLPFPTTIRNRYPPVTTAAWDFYVVDDLSTHPFEVDSPHRSLNMRSSLRLPIRLAGKVVAGLNFMSRDAARYTSEDVLVGRRIAEHVALALSHFRLAEDAREAAALRERTANLELLDGLLAALIDTGRVHDVFDKISAIAQKVLAHDALALPVLLSDGSHAWVYAASGLPAGAPDVLAVPDSILQDVNWEYEIVDDIAERPEPHHVRAASYGFRSVLRVPIRLEGRVAAALGFASRTPGFYKAADILVARRIADRIALTLAGDRMIQASRRADEAAARAARLESRVRELTEELDERTGFRRVVGESKEWRRVLTQATQVAPNETTVLLLGESGTGKEVVARFIHRASPRDKGPFVALNCAALPEQLLEAELFGYERGAYTGATQSKPGQLEQAAGGTLLLDEVGEMSLPAQAKFLRVLQEREFQRLGGTRVLRSDARIIAATNRDLPKAIAHGQFREDLYYRLNVFAIRLPAIRDRREDVLPLSEAFLKEIARGLGRPPAGISRDARQMLVEYHWPGNVRELRNILERAAILCEGGLITAEHLALMPAPAPPAAVPMPVAVVEAAPSTVSSASDLHTLERAMVEHALKTARFNKSKAAKALGLTRQQLYVRMKRYGLD
jgi:transcriptional regulator with GAF, ATPase, and Fis domain